jgi:hypothetical protein
MPIRKVQGHKEGLELSGTHQPLVCPDDDNVLGENMNTNSMTRNPSSEADSHSARQGIPRLLWNPKVH